MLDAHLKKNVLISAEHLLFLGFYANPTIYFESLTNSFLLSSFPPSYLPSLFPSFSFKLKPSFTILSLYEIMILRVPW